jgi:hypothetical protein
MGWLPLALRVASALLGWQAAKTIALPTAQRMKKKNALVKVCTALAPWKIFST